MPKLHRFFLTLALLPIPFSAFAQCSDWETFIHYRYVTIYDAARDKFGNLYVVGSFHVSDFTLGQYTFVLPPDGTGAFIAKFDKNHSLLWATSPQTNARAFATSVEVDANQNVVVGGDFDTSISFGCIALTGSGRQDLFVVTYLQDGTPGWAIASTGVDDATIAGLKISSNGNIIIISNFVEKSSATPWLTAPDISIGGVPVVTGAVSQIDGGYDSFVAAIRPDGRVAWTQGIGGDGNAYDYVLDVATDSKDNIIVTGYFSSPYISFDGHHVHKFTISQNYYLAKLDAAGQTQWVRETEGGNDQGGWGVTTDTDDDIFVVGRFYGDAKFGPLHLSGNGDADVFVVKLNPDGIALNARSIGNDGFDSGTQVKIDSHGRVLIAAYYYSEYLEVGNFSSSKPPESPGHSFVATLSNDLDSIECVKFVTGDGESILWRLELDPFDNALAMIDRILLAGSSIFDSHTITDVDFWTVMAVLGDNPATDAGEPQEPVIPQVSLGEDITICSGESLDLFVVELCNAQYMWSTGSIMTRIDVSEPGLYWVEITWQGQTIRDEINISIAEPLDISLGEDRIICPGTAVTWTLPWYENASYLWSTGESTREKTVTTPGTYWVEVSNRCESVRETIVVTAKSPVVVDLGDDIIACEGEDVTLQYHPAPDETLRWSDGSTAPTLSVRQSGTFQLTVSNGCTETSDEIGVVVIAGLNEDLVPNVVTQNGDEKNEKFTLSPGQPWSLLIYNRWGKRVYYAPLYENNWPSEDITAGVYFYTLRGSCGGEAKGLIHVIH